MKTNKLPYIKWFSSDFLTGVRGMSASQIGVYTILLNEMYERCEPLPLNEKRLAWQCGCTKTTFNKALKMLLDENKIIIKNDGLWNSRVEKEFINRQKRSDTATDNINKRWGKDNKINGHDIQTYNNGNTGVILNQKPETRIQKEEKIYKKEFEEFYNIYPRKVGKRIASNKYETTIKEVSHEELIKAVTIYAESVKGKEKRFIPHPTTWLNAGRWMDETEEAEFDPLEYLRKKREDEDHEDT